MSANRGGQIAERIQLLHLARAHHRQQASNRDLAILAAISEHDFAPLDRDALILIEADTIDVNARYLTRWVAVGSCSILR